MFEIPSEPVIISCAITGNKTTRAMNSNLPITPKEQGIAAEQAVAAGASVIHIHVREDDGTESHRVERFAEAIDEIKSRVPEAIIEVSTRGVDQTWEYSGAALKLKPEMCSLNIGTMNLKDSIFINPPVQVKRLISQIEASGALPEIDTFDIGHIEQALSWHRKGILKGSLRFLFVLGHEGGASAEPRNLMHMLSLLPSGTHWTAMGAGKYMFYVLGMAAILGGNVRVGMEDSCYIDKGMLANSNAQMVMKAVKIVNGIGRRVATPDEARQLLGLKPKITTDCNCYTDVSNPIIAHADVLQTV
ncbi:MAG: 3-keto-5-aminohexanoate cleavage protein [Chroococcidiopsidaceae cyanobacterium CP_BM_RX_35]|nr:3-keto-5-aminohexanoate cleavage protein [Chroococcidiopsidaceae cyanobacterium CP_BM_RX_35]